ncbi:MAG: histidine kinase [Ferruginibacter sp.]|nr:histidine kinase [Chitinophagaceae bacterium]
MWIGKTRYWIFQAIGWGSFMLLHLFFNWSLGKIQTADDRIMFFGRAGIFILLGLFLTHIMRIFIIRLNLLQKKLEKQIFQFVLVTMVFSFIAAYGDLLLRQRFEFLSPKEGELLQNKNLGWLIISNSFSFFVYFFIWSAIYFMYHYISKSRKQQLDTLRLESLVKELELQTIKAHINPHFIFNSLNSIRALVDENPQRARKAVTELSNILRSSLQSEKMETVTLEEELSIVKDYLALENMRFEDRLKIEYDIDEDTLDQPIPPMMLQTLVENAIKHGISKQVNGGVVKVTSDFKNNYHELIVQNTGQLNGSVNTEGFGLSSTTNRLNLLYGDKARFEIKQINGSLVEAKVLIPVHTT